MNIGNFLGDVGKVLQTTAIGLGVGYTTGGPLGALLGGAYGVGKGIYGIENNKPSGISAYQTILPAAALGLVAGQTLPGANAALNGPDAPLLHNAPTQGQILGAQLDVLGHAVSGAPSAIAGGTNSFVSSIEGGLSKFATQGALVGIASKFFGSAKVPAGVSLPTGAQLAGYIPVPTGGQPAGAPVIINGGQAPQAAATSPLLLIAAVGVGVWFFFGKHNKTAHA